MGQRAFRGRLTDSLIKNYLYTGSESSQNADYSTSVSNSQGLENSCDHFQGKIIDLNIEFDIDSPLKEITEPSDLNCVLSRGMINSLIPKGTMVKNLNLVIKSSLFGEGKTPLHSNLYILFGSYFATDIRNVYIKLYNPITNKFYNDRKTISNILDFMCFKTIKLVNINKSLLYYVIPEYSEFAVVLAYKDINFYEKCQFNFLACLEDQLFHPYRHFERKVENFMRCLNAIEKTLSGEVNNIILPVIFFNNLDKEVILNFNKKKIVFPDLNQFFKEIGLRFKIMSLELKVKFEEMVIFIDKEKEIDSNKDKEKEIDSNKDKENAIIKTTVNTDNNFLLTNTEAAYQFINLVIEENYNLLKDFTYSFISFDISTNNIDTNFNKQILNNFKKILIKKQLTNLTLANHISYSLKNTTSVLDDSFDLYDYIYYDKSFSDQIWTLLLSLKNNKIFNRIYKKKSILNNVLLNLFDFSRIFTTGSINYSTQKVKNKKIVPFEVTHNNMIIFSN